MQFILVANVWVACGLTTAIEKITIVRAMSPHRAFGVARSEELHLWTRPCILFIYISSLSFSFIFEPYRELIRYLDENLFDASWRGQCLCTKLAHKGRHFLGLSLFQGDPLPCSEAFALWSARQRFLETKSPTRLPCNLDCLNSVAMLGPDAMMAMALSRTYYSSPFHRLSQGPTTPCSDEYTDP